MPSRVQLRRTRGWRKPAAAIVVARPSRWGNPFPIAAVGGREEAVRLYREYLLADARLLAEARRLLAGHDLACWCPLDVACHADVLLELANT